jgi:hypothetical protein
MRIWLAGQRHIPEGTRALLEATGTSERAANVAQDGKPQAEGAANALRRLESAEARAYADFKQATASGDDIRIRASRENWLKISESLRRFDLAIEQARRDAGDLVPKEAALRMCYEIKEGLWFAFLAMEQACPFFVGLTSPLQAWELLTKLRDSVLASVTTHLGRAQKHPLPKWMVKAVTLGEFPTPNAAEQYAVFWAALSELLKSVGEDARSRLDEKIESHLTKIQ